MNRYLEKLASISLQGFPDLEKLAALQAVETPRETTQWHADFTPDLTPEEMKALGVLKGKYFPGESPSTNYFGVDASLKEWPEHWHNEEHPLGWFQWYEGYAQGKRTPDDERQIKRWKSFKARHMAQLLKADPTGENLSVQPRRRQALLHWGIAPGLKK